MPITAHHAWRRGAAIAVLGLAGALAPSAAAAPVVAAFAVTPERAGAGCAGHGACLRVTFRAVDGDLPAGRPLTVRFVARGVDDARLTVNVLRDFPNGAAPRRWWIVPPRGLGRGRYVARIVVVGAGTGRSPVRGFTWSG